MSLRTMLTTGALALAAVAVASRIPALRAIVFGGTTA
jgi:hypothetical protein